MDNSLKRATALMAVVLMLTGCSSQDNKSNNHSTDDARLEPVEQAYDGCDKLLGSDHGSFKLPEKISKVDFNKVYSLSCNTLKNDDMTNAEKLFKTFYGDDFDESALSTDNGGIVYQAGMNTSAYWGMDIALYSADYEFQENNSGQTYVVGLDEGDITLGGKAIDVTDIDSGLNNYLADFYKDFTINTKEFSVNDTVGRIDFTASLDYENVPFQYSPSAYSRADNENNMSYWTFLQVTGSIGADGKFDFINANAPLNILDKTEKTEMIPFDEVEQYIGHAPGGVCPFGINEGVDVYLDESLRQFDTVYPAAGNDHSAVRLAVPELEKIAGAKGWIDVCKEPEKPE